MIHSSRGGETRVFAIVVVVTAVLAVIVAVAVSTRQAERGRGTNITVSNTNTDPTTSWSRYFYRPFRVSLKLPPGMNICERGDSGFEFRTDACDSATKAAFAFRRSEAWTTIDPVAAFNEAFGQELREAGLTTIEGKGTQETREGTVIIWKTFSDEFSGALIAEAEDNRRIAVDIRVAESLVLNDVTFNRNEIITTTLKHMSFTTAVQKSEQPSP